MNSEKLKVLQEKLYSTRATMSIADQLGLNQIVNDLQKEALEILIELEKNQCHYCWPCSKFYKPKQLREDNVCPKCGEDLRYKV